MRAAAILGLGSSLSDLKPFQTDPSVQWTMGLPGSPEEADIILILGGDGTIHRHLAQLSRLQRPVLVVPRGSGNDFARALGLAKVRDSVAAWRRFLQTSDNVRTIDLGTITPVGDNPLATSPYSLPRSHYFCCAGGCGLDSEAARRANQLPAWLRGHGGYAISLLGALRRFKPIGMKIEAPSQGTSQISSSRYTPAMLIAFANAPFYGGGMRLAPKAAMDDHKLDFCVVRRVNKLRLSYLFPSVYFGRHLRIPEVDYFQGDRLRLETDRPLDVYADGEYVCHTPIEVGIAPNAFQVIVPR
jgi:YegS/Rv2252/BmrU family lipid kinase